MPYLPYEEMYFLIRDNLYLKHITSDDCHKQYEDVSNLNSVIKVRDFADKIFPKDIYPRYHEQSWLAKFADHYMYIAASHYDCHEEFLMQFAVKEERR